MHNYMVSCILLFAFSRVLPSVLSLCDSQLTGDLLIVKRRSIENRTKSGKMSCAMVGEGIRTTGLSKQERAQITAVALAGSPRLPLRGTETHTIMSRP